MRNQFLEEVALEEKANTDELTFQDGIDVANEQYALEALFSDFNTFTNALDKAFSDSMIKTLSAIVSGGGPDGVPGMRKLNNSTALAHAISVSYKNVRKLLADVLAARKVCVAVKAKLEENK